MSTNENPPAQKLTAEEIKKALQSGEGSFEEKTVDVVRHTAATLKGEDKRIIPSLSDIPIQKAEGALGLDLGMIILKEACHIPDDIKLSLDGYVNKMLEIMPSVRYGDKKKASRASEVLESMKTLPTDKSVNVGLKGELFR